MDYFINELPAQDPHKEWIDTEAFGIELGHEEKGPLLATAFLRWVGIHGAQEFFEAESKNPASKFRLERMHWKYVEGTHSALQSQFTSRRKALNPNKAIKDVKLLDLACYKDIHGSLKRLLHGEKGEGGVRFRRCLPACLPLAD